jgi:glycosyltransferase involved in cell wall biosynthesis
MPDHQVSVIIPTYNHGRFLGRCLDAALCQTYPPLEVIVVDDGSRDDTRRVVEPYLGRVTYIHQENQGLSGARNTGAARSRAEWMLFCDADDRLVPQALEWLVATIPPPGAGIVYGRCREHFPNGHVGRILSSAGAAGPPPRPAQASFWKSAITTTGTALIHRDAFTTVGGYHTPWPVEDREFWIKAGMFYPFAYTEHVVLEKYVNANSLGSRKGDRIWGAMVVQLELLDWCRARGLDPGLLVSGPSEIIANALRYSVAGGHWQHTARILMCARRHRTPPNVIAGAVFRQGLPAFVQHARSWLLSWFRA